MHCLMAMGRADSPGASSSSPNSGAPGEELEDAGHNDTGEGGMTAQATDDLDTDQEEEDTNLDGELRHRGNATVWRWNIMLQDFNGNSLRISDGYAPIEHIGGRCREVRYTSFRWQSMGAHSSFGYFNRPFSMPEDLPRQIIRLPLTLSRR